MYGFICFNIIQDDGRGKKDSLPGLPLKLVQTLELAVKTLRLLV